MSRVLAVVDGTIRESMAKFTFLAFVIMSTLTLLTVAFAVNLDVVDGALATARLFGRQVQLGGMRMDIDSLVTGIQTGLAGLIFGIGLFLSIFATANLVPVMLEKGFVDLLLSKPLSRPALFLGRYLGALAVVLINLIYLMGGFWILMGWKTGIWKPGLLLAGIVIVLTYAVLLGFMMLIGVITRSSSITIMLTYVLFPLAGILAAREYVTVMLNSKVAVAFIDGLYYALPKLAGLGQLMKELAMGQPVTSYAPLGSSLLFGAACLATATFYFSRKDY